MKTTLKKKKVKFYSVPGHAHELTFSCYKNQTLLSNDRTRKYFCEAVDKAQEKHNIHVWAYVIMPEHIHLLIYPNNENYSISRILLSIKQSVARRELIYIRKYNPENLKYLATNQKHTPYRFWQDGGGYDRNVVINNTLINMVNYIHNNPVRKGLVKCPDDWEWSSWRDWYSEKKGLINIDLTYYPVV